MGSKPMSFAATASIATESALARITLCTRGNIVRGPGAVAGDGSIHNRKHVGVQLPLHEQQIHHDLVDVFVRIVPHFLEESAEGILDRARGHGVVRGS